MSHHGGGTVEKGLGAPRRAQTQWVSYDRARFPEASREAAGSPAPLPASWKKGRIAHAVSRWSIEETARASFWAKMATAFSWPGVFSKRARDCWPAPRPD